MNLTYEIDINKKPKIKDPFSTPESVGGCKEEFFYESPQRLFTENEDSDRLASVFRMKKR